MVLDRSDNPGDHVLLEQAGRREPKNMSLPPRSLSLSRSLYLSFSLALGGSDGGLPRAQVRGRAWQDLRLRQPRHCTLLLQ